MTEFYWFDEDNDHEGETWSFFIPVEGNAEAVDALIQAFAKVDGDEGEDIGYSFRQKTLPESEVDVLVKHGGSRGYMARYTKLEGKLDASAVVAAAAKEHRWEAVNDLVYKGGIAKLMYPVSAGQSHFDKWFDEQYPNPEMQEEVLDDLKEAFQAGWNARGKT